MPSRFDRFIPVAGMQLLETQPGWWKEMLAFRYRDPQGKEQPLFLSTRKGYMNAYVEGQSILRIAFGRASRVAKLIGEVHHKYVRDEAEGQSYLKFDGHDYFDKQGNRVHDPDAVTLAARVNRARNYVGDEKRGVAVIVGRHAQVIDVEMALPANASSSPDVRPTAPRMDIVAVEEDGEGARIVFYEAKRFGNPELRARNFRPRVQTQLLRYVDWMKSPERADEVISAYRRACRIHIQVHAMRVPGSASPVHPLIERAALDGSLLTVDPHPRLVIFDYEPGEDGASPRDPFWPPHEKALRDNGITLIMGPRPEDIVLS